MFDSSVGQNGPDEYRQMASYVVGEYGTAGFIVTRDDEGPLSDLELPWMKEIYNGQRKLVVKLTGRFFGRILSKLRSPQRHDEADLQLDLLLDRYATRATTWASRSNRDGSVRRNNNRAESALAATLGPTWGR
jgi:hypothetical protein